MVECKVSRTRRTKGGERERERERVRVDGSESGQGETLESHARACQTARQKRSVGGVSWVYRTSTAIACDRLQDEALFRVLLSGAAGGCVAEDGARGFDKHLVDVDLLLGTALEVLDGIDLGGDGVDLLERQQRLAARILAEVTLETDENELAIGAVVADLGPPLGLDVLERRIAVDTKAHEEDVGLGVGQRAETLVALLACRVP